MYLLNIKSLLTPTLYLNCELGNFYIKLALNILRVQNNYIFVLTFVVTHECLSALKGVVAQIYCTLRPVKIQIVL